VKLVAIPSFFLQQVAAGVRFAGAIVVAVFRGIGNQRPDFG
jgi:hypothetical protein